MDIPAIEHTRTHDGVRIAYWEVGEGPPVLFIRPPLGANLLEWWAVPGQRHLTELLAAHSHVVQYDVRGCGLSDDAADLELDSCVSDATAVLRAAAVARCAVVAMVHGAPTAIALAAAHPELVSSLTLLGPEIDFERRATIISVLARRVPGHVFDSIRRVMNPQLSPADEEGIRAMSVASAQRWVLSDGTSAIQEAMQRWRVDGLLHKVHAPTLIVHYPGHVFSDGPSVARGIHAARLVARSGDNQPPYNPDPEGLARLVTAFVLQHAAPRPSAPTRPSGDPTHRALSVRETEVLRLLVPGATNAEIARALKIRPNTVKRHVSSIFLKTGARNRTEAARIAQRSHLV